MPRSGPWMAAAARGARLRAARHASSGCSGSWAARRERARRRRCSRTWCVVAAGVWSSSARCSARSGRASRASRRSRSRCSRCSGCARSRSPRRGRGRASERRRGRRRSGARSQRGRRRSAALARGAPVFVYFTADWCLTCKVNEHVVLEDARVRAAARAPAASRPSTATGRAATRRSASELARFGKAGVPLVPGVLARARPEQADRAAGGAHRRPVPERAAPAAPTTKENRT